MSVGGLAFDKILVMEEIHVFAAVQTFFIFMWKLYQMGSTNFKKLKKGPRGGTVSAQTLI